ncbi:hypothetical protein [Nostoc sp. ChiQUE01b]|uniref:hypothetical protein n=1 Tax=Nostoc sp. ChiQUE01b TaxID=3075376 RepID=UPI002AD46912|nr:hypothetical protein [Nostoc sp. ChiQUE01b]
MSVPIASFWITTGRIITGCPKLLYSVVLSAECLGLEYNPIVKTRGLKQGHIVLKNRSTWGFAQDRVFRFFTACRVPLKNISIFFHK